MRGRDPMDRFNQNQTNQGRFRDDDDRRTQDEDSNRGYDREWSPSRATERGMSSGSANPSEEWRSEGGWAEDRRFDRDDRGGSGYGGSSSYGGSRLRDERETGSYGYGSGRSSQFGGQYTGQYGGQYGQYGGRYGYGATRSTWSPGRSQVGRQNLNRGDQSQDESWRGRELSDSSRYDRDFSGNRDDRGLLERAGDWIQEKLGKAPKGYTRSDDRIREEVSEAIWRRGDVDASNVEIVVKDAEVTLNGTVNDRRAKRQIEDIAEDVLGVNDVHNHIKVRREGELYSERDKLSGSSSTSSTSTTTPTTSKTPRA